MSTYRDFTFPGLWPYIERAAEGRRLPFLGRGRSLWHYKQVQDSLGQLSGLDAAARRELLAHVESVRDSLAAALDGIDLAVLDSIRGLDEPSGAPSAAPISVGPAEPSPRRGVGARRRRD
jgi:hypothetical protein